MSALDELIHSYQDSTLSQNHGFLFSVTDSNGKPIYKKAVGPTRLPDQRRFDENSLILLVSGSKIMTSVAVMIAVQKGLLSLDEPVERIMPKFADWEILRGFEMRDGVERAILQKKTKSITLRHLLTHTSGFAYVSLPPHFPQFKKWAKCERGWSGEQLKAGDYTASMDAFNTPLLFEPGEGFAYGPGIDWAGRILETVTGVSLEKFYKEHIWSVLKMNDTTFYPKLRPDLLARRAAMGLIGKPETYSGLDLYPLNPPDCLGGLGVCSTPKDMDRFLNMILRGGEGLLSRESIAELFKPQCLPLNGGVVKGMDTFSGGILRNIFPESAPVSPGFGCCVALKDVPGRRMKGSIGWLSYANFHWWIDPTTGISAALYMQALPMGHRQVTKFLNQLEEAVYKDVESGVFTKSAPMARL